jgi:aspartate kinase
MLQIGERLKSVAFFRRQEVSTTPEVSRRPLKIVKFGGDNMATADNIKKSTAILASDPQRLIAVVSAPGKRFKGDEKVTDLLIKSSKSALNQESFYETFGKVRGRFVEISQGLFEKDQASQDFVLNLLRRVEEGILIERRENITATDPAEREIRGKRAVEWAASRGEWLMGQIFARYLQKTNPHVRFKDAADMIRISSKNQLLADQTRELVTRQLKDVSELTVVGGFYGLDGEGYISTFERGGSDTTAAALAAGLNAKVVEMFKKLHGVKSAQPDIVPYARTIPEMTYDELFELAFRGFDVVQKSAVQPVYDMNIPIEVRSFDTPDLEGTRIVREREYPRTEKITGVAGKSGYVAVTVRKEGMNAEQGILSNILAQYREHVGSVDHSPTITNATTTIFDASQLNGNYGETMDKLLEGIKLSVEPDDIDVNDSVAVLCVVGPQIRKRQAAASAKIMRLFDKNDVRVLAQSAIPGGVTLVYAIHCDQIEKAVKLVHDKTVHGRNRTRGLFTKAA